MYERGGSRLNVGGEKTFSPADIFSAEKNNFLHGPEEWSAGFHLNYTFGGYSSMLAITDDLVLKKLNRVVLLPSYLCGEIPVLFNQRGFETIFYRIDSDLIPDFDHINELLSLKPAAVMFIDYMGRSLEKLVGRHQEVYRSAGIKVIQDSVQRIDFTCGGYYGDYIFNSFRKITPYEGSIIMSREPMKINFTGRCHLRFLLNKRAGQLLRKIHQRFGLFSPRIFLNLIERAEVLYSKPDIFRLTRFSRHMIGTIDFTVMLAKRMVLHQKLKEAFSSFMPVSLAGDDYYPYGFFILVEGRDEIRKRLRQQGIYCPVHWHLPGAVDPEQFVVSSYISERTLTIPFTGIDEKNIDLVINTIKNNIIK